MVQEVMLDVFAAPPRNRYQIITEHPMGPIIAEDTGLGLERSDGVTVSQIFQQGRTTEQKQAAYAQLGLRLEAGCGVRPEGLIVSVTANERADWSFGLGRAQFIEGNPLRMVKCLDKVLTLSVPARTFSGERAPGVQPELRKGES